MLNPLSCNPCWVIFASCSWQALSIWILRSLWFWLKLIQKLESSFKRVLIGSVSILLGLEIEFQSRFELPRLGGWVRGRDCRVHGDPAAESQNRNEVEIKLSVLLQIWSKQWLCFSIETLSSIRFLFFELKTFANRFSMVVYLSGLQLREFGQLNVVRVLCWDL